MLVWRRRTFDSTQKQVVEVPNSCFSTPIYVLAIIVQATQLCSSSNALTVNRMQVFATLAFVTVTGS